MEVIIADPSRLQVLTQLVLKLWPEHESCEMEQELSHGLKDPDSVFFLAYIAQKPAGFAQCGLRRDYVEGTDSTPVGYLEGIYVEPQYRTQGIARALLCACEVWARERGCREFASDCQLDNIQSLQFHLASGFQEANRIICFTKKL